MAEITPEMARVELAKRELQSRQQINGDSPQEDNTSITPANEQSGMLQSALQAAGKTGLGVAQGVANIGHGIGDLETRLVNSMLGTQLKSPQPDLYSATGVKPSTASKVGEIGGEIGAGGAFVAALAPLMGIPAAMAATGAATTEGGVKERAIAASKDAVLGKAGESIPKAYKYFKKHTSPKEMGSLLDKFASKVDTKSKKLYDTAYKGTGKAKPVISNQSMDGFKDILQRPGSSKIKESVKIFKKDPTLSNYHGIKKDVQSTIRNLQSKSSKSGLGGADSDLLQNLGKLSGNIEKDLEKGFSRLEPKKYDQFRAAQSHHAKNKVPLKKYKSVRDYLGEEKTISNALKRDLSKDESTAQFLREQIGINKKTLDKLKGINKLTDLKSVGKFALLSKLFGG